MIKVWVGRNVHSEEIQGRSKTLEEATGRDAFFIQDLWTSKVGTKLEMPYKRDRRLFMVSRDFVVPLAT